MSAGKVLVALPAGDTVIADLLEQHGHLTAAMLVREMGEAPEVDDRPVCLWHLSQTDNDGYDSCIVAAYDEQEARRIHPGPWHNDGRRWWDDHLTDNWALNPSTVTARCIGMTTTAPAGAVVCASYSSV